MLGVFICCFSEKNPSKVCVRVSTATLPAKTNSYENVDISACEHPYSVGKLTVKLEEAASIQEIVERVFSCLHLANKKASPSYFILLLFVT